jgi:hypothetical protein
MVLIKNFLGSLILFLCLILFISCETSFDNNISNDLPFITEFSISPEDINFDNLTTEVIDTTINVNISGQVKKITEDTRLIFSVTDIQNNVQVEEGNLNLTSISPLNGNFDKNIVIEVSTSTFSNFLVVVTATDKNGNGNYAQSVLKIKGISNSAPQIIEVDNPTEYVIPQSETENIRFTAKVIDEDGQNNIQGVFLRLISRTTGEASGSPFELYDDGQSLGDQVASDSVFTLTFPVSSDNQPDTYDIHYFATDRGGLSSDTVKTSFSLIE